MIHTIMIHWKGPCKAHTKISLKSEDFFLLYSEGLSYWVENSNINSDLGSKVDSK